MVTVCQQFKWINVAVIIITTTRTMVKHKKKKYPELDISQMLPEGLVDVKQLAARFVSKKRRRAHVHGDQRRPADPKRFYRPVPMAKRRQILFLRHGSDGKSGPFATKYFIAKKLGLGQSTVTRILRRFYETHSLKDRPKPNRRKSKIDADLRAKLICPLLLQSWHRHNLTERVHQIKQDFGVEISATTLLKFYKENRVGYRNADIVKRRAYMRQPHLHAQR